MQKLYFRNSIKNVLLIFAMVLSCNWMLLLNDGFFWDDNLFYALLSAKNYDELTTFILETGLPINIILFRAVDGLFGVYNHRILSFITILASACILHNLFIFYTAGENRLAYYFSLLYITLFPFKSTVLLSTIQYQLSLFLFLIAIYIRSKYLYNNFAFIKWGAYSVFIIFTLLSFNAASILVLFYFFLIFEFLHENRFDIYSCTFSAIFFYLRRNCVEVFLPVAYWCTKLVFFPVHGLYENYNKIDISLSQNLSVYKAFFLDIFVYGSFYKLAVNAPAILFSIICTFLFLMAFPRYLGKSIKEENSGKFDFNMPAGSAVNLYLMISIAFLFISALPYVLVNTPPSFQGWNSRHFLLFTLSLPIFVLTFVVAFLVKIKEVYKIDSVFLIFKNLTLCICIVGFFSSNLVYFDYQILAIKQHAIVENLKEKQELKKYSGFWIDDRIDDFSKRKIGVDETPYQAWYEWVAVFKAAWFAERWYGNNIKMHEDYYKSKRYGASDINPNGNKCKIILYDASSYSRSGIFRRYFLYKYFGTEVQLKEFLLSLVKIETCEK